MDYAKDGLGAVVINWRFWSHKEIWHLVGHCWQVGRWQGCGWLSARHVTTGGDQAIIGWLSMVACQWRLADGPNRPVMGPCRIKDELCLMGRHWDAAYFSFLYILLDHVIIVMFAVRISYITFLSKKTTYGRSIIF